MAEYSMQYSSPSMLPFYNFFLECAFFTFRRSFYTWSCIHLNTTWQQCFWTSIWGHIWPTPPPHLPSRNCGGATPAAEKWTDRKPERCGVPHRKEWPGCLWRCHIQGVVRYGVEPNTAIGSNLIISLISHQRSNSSICFTHFQVSKKVAKWKLLLRW